VGAVVLTLDQATKALVTAELALHQSLSIVPGFFDLTHVLNAGGVWGLGGDASPAVRSLVFLALPALITAFAFWYSLQLPPAERVRHVALALLVGGALGNLLDRLRLGHVVDFLLFHWKGRWSWPAFNVADTAICIGVGVLLVASVAERDGETGAAGG
jgi:signal peptidase II